jgi:uncharacterized membrane protein YuzA (DUF378 family)
MSATQGTHEHDHNTAARVQSNDEICGWKTTVLAVSVIVAAVFFGVIGLLSELNLLESLVGSMRGDVGFWTAVGGFGVAGIATLLLITRQCLDRAHARQTQPEPILV